MAADLQNRMRQRIEDELLARMRDDRVHLGQSPQTAPAEQQPDVQPGLEDGLVAILARILRMPAEKIDVQEKVSRYGVNSIIVTEIMQEVSVLMGVKIVPTVFFEASNIRELADILGKRYAGMASKPIPKPVPSAAKAKVEVPPRELADDDEIDSWIRKSRAFSTGRAGTFTGKSPSDVAASAYEPIAVIGMQGAFPRSPDLDQYWRNLVEGLDCIEEVPADRWDWRSVSGDPDEGPYTDIRWGGFIGGIDRFDAGFFGIAPNEAELMDPQHRLFMQASWALLESAGIAPAALQGRRVGVFAGVNLNDYGELIDRNSDDVDPLLLNGTMHMFCPGRVSFMLRSTGPSQAIDTACSSSLVAVHRAAVSLQRRESELALAGGVNLLMGPDRQIFYTKARMLSADGRSRAFAEDADGYGRSDGLGVVLLKRLEDAQRDGDEVLAVIRGSSENHQGTAASLTALNPKAMSGVIADAMRHAQADPRRLGYVECHGPCTTLGDSIEFNALRQAFEERYAAHGVDHPSRAHCGIGTVKSNIGHAETAAGIAGMLKVILAMRHGYLPPSLYCEQGNPLLEMSGTDFYLARQGAEWPRPIIDSREQPRMAGVSSFGAGGTNAHVILEEYRPSEQTAGTPCLRCHAREPLLVPLSAHSPDRLQAVAAGLLDFLQAGQTAGQEPELLRLSYTLQTGRDALQHRVLFLVRDIAGLQRQLKIFLAPGEQCADFVQGERSAQEVRSMADGGAELLKANRLRELARAWVQGARIDWALMYGSPAPRRMALPTYPFAAERHWIGGWEPAKAIETDSAWETRAIAEDLDWLNCLQQALRERIVLLYSDEQQNAAFMDRLNPLIRAAGLERAPSLQSWDIRQADAELCAAAGTILILGPGNRAGEGQQQDFEDALAEFARYQQKRPGRDPQGVYCLYEDATGQGAQRAERLVAQWRTNTRDAVRLIEHFDTSAGLDGQERLLKEWLADETESAPGVLEIRYARSRRQVRGAGPRHEIESRLQQLEARTRRGERIMDEELLELIHPEQVGGLDARTTDRLYALMQAGPPEPERPEAESSLLHTVREALREILKLPSVDDRHSFQNYGLNSVSAMRFATRLEKRLGRQVRAEWFLEHCCVRELTDYLGSGPASDLTPVKT